jgi:hypothetical protein
MEVFILHESADHESDAVFGVFSSLEKAVAHAQVAFPHYSDVRRSKFQDGMWYLCEPLPDPIPERSVTTTVDGEQVRSIGFEVLRFTLDEATWPHLATAESK